MAKSVYIGISGWRYPRWRGVFYPKGLPHRAELDFAGKQFNSLEINGSFYSLQRPELYREWHDTVPKDFVFSLKGSRFITHMKKLRDVKTPLANFFASGVLALGEKLGPILWQFPPRSVFNPGLFADFFDLLPKTTAEASSLARRHDGRIHGRAFLRGDSTRVIRHAVEIRHESFRSPDFFKVLKKHNIALVVADTAGKWPFIETQTADFAYFRLHGDKTLYHSGYTEQALNRWAARVRRANKIGDVYVYFDNDAKVHAPFNAVSLQAKLRGKVARKR
ncbi:MAG: DUF72 domain-containing protein [Bdellovibrionota bacterium]